MTPQKIFLNPHNLLVHEVVTWLLTQARRTPAGALTLAHLLLVMPTRHATRHLRQALAEKVGAGLPPRIIMVKDIFAPAANVTVISDSENRALLAKFLLHEKIAADYPQLFPNLPANYDFAWALTTATVFNNIWTLLAENALTMNEVAIHVAREHLPDVDRWQELAALEKKFFAQLKKLSRTPAALARQQAVENPALDLTNIEQIILPALADAQPAFYPALKNLVAKNPRVNITVLLPAATNGVDENSFDDFGRPLPEHWQENIRVPLSEAQITLAADPAAQAEKVAAFFAAIPAKKKLPALGLLDATLFGELHSAFLAHKKNDEKRPSVTLHSPANHPLAVSALGRVALQLLSLHSEKSYSTLAAWLREYDVMMWLTWGGKRQNFNYQKMLAQLDEVQNKHLPRTLAAVALYAKADLKIALDAVAELLTTTELTANLRQIFAHRYVKNTDVVDREFIAALNALKKILDNNNSEIITAQLNHRERAQLLADEIRRATYQLEPTNENVLLTDGWFELQWSPQTHLCLTGFNEGIVPEAIVGDVLVPDSLRCKLGLHDNRRRTARDLFLFKTLIDARPTNNNDAHNAVQIFLSQVNAAGDTQKPSRLLFLCDDETLPQRAQKLYTDAEKAVKPSWYLPAAWKLNLPPLPRREKISITKVKSYLDAPLTFYLRETFGAAIADREREINALTFGMFCHQALQTFAQTDAIKRSINAAEISAFLRENIAAQITKNFGKKPPLIIRLQEQAMLASVRDFATQQAAWTRAGWEIVAAEQDLNFTLTVAGTITIIKGKFDRLDRRENSYRFLDYKTGALSEPATDPQYYFQLALYYFLARENNLIPQHASAEGGYFALSDAPTTFTPHELTGEIVDAEYAKLTQAITQINAGIFWATDYAQGGKVFREDLKRARREFPLLFTADVEDCLSPQWLEQQYELIAKYETAAFEK